MAKKVKVQAIRDGHDGTAYRNKGAVFFVDAERLKDGSDWFVPVKDAEPAPEESEA